RDLEEAAGATGARGIDDEESDAGEQGVPAESRLVDRRVVAAVRQEVAGEPKARQRIPPRSAVQVDDQWPLAGGGEVRALRARQAHCIEMPGQLAFAEAPARR